MNFIFRKRTKCFIFLIKKKISYWRLVGGRLIQALAYYVFEIGII